MTVTSDFSAILTIHIGLTVTTCIKDGVKRPNGRDETVEKRIPLHSIVSPVMIIELHIVWIEALNYNM